MSNAEIAELAGPKRSLVNITINIVLFALKTVARPLSHSVVKWAEGSNGWS